MNKPSSHQGIFLLIAVVFILVIGFMGLMIAYTLANRGELSVAQLNGLYAFYNAESALEIGTRLLTMPSISGTPSRISCSALTGNAAVTNASLSVGTFTLSAANNAPFRGYDNLTSAITASSTSIPITSISGFASSGRILIDREAIDYTALSGSSFIGVTRGVANTTAASHASGAPVSQFQCSIDALTGIPDLVTPGYQREIKKNVQLQEAWVVGNLTSNTNVLFGNWNRYTELGWNSGGVSSGGGGNASIMNSLSLLSGGDGWASGNTSNNGNFLILRYNGIGWTPVSVTGSCNSQHLLGISAVSSQEAWAVGVTYKPNCAGGQNRLTILRWNGSTWTLLTPSTSPAIPSDSNANNNTLNDVHVIDTNGDGLGDAGFAVGNTGQIVRYNGTNWVTTASTVTQNLYGIFVTSASEAWAVGAAGRILRWNGTAWGTFTSPTINQLNGIFMLDTDNDGLANVGWAVGDLGTLLYYNGSTFSIQTSLNVNNLKGVAAFNAKDAWAVGAAGTALHWDGNSWTAFSPGTIQQLNHISVVSAGQQNPSSSWQQVFK